MTLQDFLLAKQKHLQSLFNSYLPEADQPPLQKAMRYAVLNGGKRLRPLLVYITGEAFGATPEALDIPACAVEIIHCFSLIHDDLPAMDDDDLRRNLPTCHIVFGEAMAILAGDALQTLAFEILSSPTPYLCAIQQIKMIHTLAQACGKTGMTQGQAMDIANANHASIQIDTLDQINQAKTGDLITASVLLGAIAANQEDPTLINALKAYGQTMGLAFQIYDDILDIEGDTQTLGKPAISDRALGKITYPELLGLEQARRRTHQLYEQAIEALKPIGLELSMLSEIARYMITRKS